jgi:hypothetical protein
MITKPRQLSVNSFLVACVVALILLTAAVLKWVYPSGRDPIFYEIIGALEAVLAVLLFFNHKSWRIWIVLSLIVSTWMGFSFYVTLFGLPCSCMGGSLDLPRGMSFILNGLMLLGACHVLSRHPEHSIRFRRLMWFFILFFIFGFILSSIYYNYQT